MKTASIVGAGLVGSLWAVYLSKAGYKVQLFEARSDIRKADISAGKSINLALSDRGWKALDAVGVGDEIRKIAIPMSGRICTMQKVIYLTNLMVMKAKLFILFHVVVLMPK